MPRSVERPERCFEVNATGTLRVAEAVRAAGVRRWVLSSSSSVYGAGVDPSRGEGVTPTREDAPLGALSPYAASKIAAEQVVSSWWACYGVEGVSLRFFNIFGPRQPADSAYAAVVPAFIAALSSGRRATIYGDGSNSRDLTPVANVVRAVLLAGAADTPPLGGALNVATGRSATILELYRAVAAMVGRAGVEPDFAPERTGEVPHSLADVSRAERTIGYRPVVPLEQGLAETVRWMTGRDPRPATPAPSPNP